MKTQDNELEKDRIFFDATGNAVGFLERLDSDVELRRLCSHVDLDGRLGIARKIGYEFSEAHLRVAVRIWDYHGTWRKWLATGDVLCDLDELPPLDDEYRVAKDDVETFQHKGHVLLRGVLSAHEASAYRAVIRNVLDRAKSGGGERGQQEIQLFSDVGFMSLINLRVKDPRAAKFVYARRFARIAADLMKVDRVRVYLDETFEKYPGFSRTHWHQDRLYFPLDTDNLVTMWMPIVDATVEMGTLTMASGSHRCGDFGYRPIKEESNAFYDQQLTEQGFTIEQMPDMRAGDATFHNGWLLHGAPSNLSETTREVMSVVFYPDGTRLCTPTNEYQRRAITFGFRARPGDPAVSPIHPVVFDRTASD